MIYGNISGFDKQVSKIILGCSGKPMRYGDNCDALFDAAFSVGINTFDTARGYGLSEKTLGEWVTRRKLRDKVVILTKGALHGLLGNNRVRERCIRADLQKSLEISGLEYFDIYLLHRDDRKVETGRVVELLNDFKADGKIMAFGVSNWKYDRIIAANEYAYKHNLAPLSVSEPHFSLAVAGRWSWIGCMSVTGDSNWAEREWYAESGFPLFAFSPLGGGFLSGKVCGNEKKSARNIPKSMRATFCSKENFTRLRRVEELAESLGCTVAQIALAWVLGQDINAFAITGGARVESIQSSVNALAVTLTKEQLDYLNLKN